MAMEIDIEQIARHLQKAYEKHPVFCEKIMDDYDAVNRGVELDNARSLCEKYKTAEFILDEEVSEIYEALANGNPMQAIDECFDAIAVLLRIADKIKEDAYPWEH